MKRKRWDITSGRKRAGKGVNDSYFHDGSSSTRRRTAIQSNSQSFSNAIRPTGVTKRDRAPVPFENIENSPENNLHDNPTNGIGAIGIAPTNDGGEHISPEHDVTGARSHSVRSGTDEESEPVNENTSEPQKAPEPNADHDDLISYNTLSTILFLAGSKRMSHAAYVEQTVHFNQEAAWNQRPLRPGLTKAKEICSFAESNFFVKHKVEMFPVSFCKAQAKGGRGLMYSETHAPVMVVLPSEYAKADFKSHSISQLLRDGGRSSNSMPFSHIDECPIVRNRANVLSPTSIQDKYGRFHELEKGTVLQCCITQYCFSEMSDEFRNHYVSGVSQEGENFMIQVTVNSVEVIKGSTHVLSKCLPSGCVAVKLSCVEDRRGHTDLQDTENGFLVFRTMGDGVRVSCTRTSHLTMDVPVKICEEVRVVSIVVLASDDGPPNSGDGYPSYGRLPNGERYVIYRFMLYADGFSPHIGKHGSYTGVYMMNLNIPPELRSVSGCVHRIALTPPGVSGNEVIQHISRDIAIGSTVGFSVRDADFEPYRLFLDYVGFIGDQPAVTETTDVRGHNAICPCTYCTFPRRDPKEQGTTTYAYSSSVSSRSPAFRRSNVIMDEIRHIANGDNDFLQLIGLKQIDEQESLPWPTLQLYMDNAAQCNSQATEYVCRKVDRYLSTIIAPDHLFERLCGHVIEAMIFCLSPSQRKFCNHLFKEYRVKADFHDCGSILNEQNGSLNSLTTSELNNVFFLFPSIVRNTLVHKRKDASNEGKPLLQKSKVNEIPLSTKLECLEMLSYLHKCITRVYYYPEPARDGRAICELFGRDQGMAFMSETCAMLRAYVENVHRFCVRHPRLRSRLDKPSLHRLIEFADRTLPSFGHVRFINELIFERAHQEMKGGVLKSNHRNPQIQAMRDIIANDWIRRLADETFEFCDNGDGWVEPRIRSVLRLCAVSGWADDISVESVEQLKDTFRPSVLYSLRVRRCVSLSGDLDTKSFGWESRGKSAGYDVLIDRIPNCYLKTLLKAISLPTWINTFLAEREESDLSTNVDFFGDVVYTLRKRKQNMNTSVKSRLQVGMILQAAYTPTAVRQCHTVSVVSSRNGIAEKPAFYVFILACQRRAGKSESAELYAVCCGLKKVNGLQQFTLDRQVYLVEMKEHVKACMDIHVCSTGCCVGKRCRTILEGGVHEVFGSLEGFPHTMLDKKRSFYEYGVE